MNRRDWLRAVPLLIGSAPLGGRRSGYAPKEATIWQIASADPTVNSLSGRLLNAELLVIDTC